MKIPTWKIFAAFSLVSMAWADETPTASKTIADENSDAAFMESTVDVPRLTLSNVVDLFSPHYDVTKYPMLADPKAREFMEVGTYRHLYWMLTGGERTPELKARLLLMPQDIVHEVSLARRPIHPSQESFQRRFGDAKVTGLAFPEKAIVFFLGTPANVSGASSWDHKADKPRTDMDVERVFARTRFIVETAEGSYWEESVLWMYEPEKNEFVLQSLRISTIHDGLTMLMRLHTEDDPSE